jgi:signal transduction histidine kinase/DNA-binding NarL/FixJ family response regulator
VSAQASSSVQDDGPAATAVNPEALAQPGPGPEHELPSLYDSQHARVPVPVLAAAGLIAWLASAQAPLWLTGGWWAMVAAVLALRWWVVRQAALRVQLPIEWRLNAVALVSGLGGVVHGSSVMFWPYLSVIGREVQTVFVLGLCAGAVASVFGYPRIFLAYLVPMLLAVGFAWAQALAPASGGWWRGESAVMLAMFVMYGALLAVLARDTYRLFSDGYYTRQRLQVALDQAEAANRAKTRFLASASHDLRQPMHTLTLFTAALSMRPLDERSSAITRQMNTALQSLSSQLDALLDVSKLDAGVVVATPSNLALDELLARLHAEFSTPAQHKGLALHLNCPVGARVRCDGLLFERVLRNLLDNAIKYTQRGEVVLTAKQHEHGFLVEVQDTGPGIALAEQERVFEEFYQLGNPERDRSQGLGLGLSIVRRLAALMQLPMQLRSLPGRGVVVSLQLPPADAPAQVTLTAPTALPSLQGLDVLVIDDEEAVRDGMHALLESLGCTVRVAASTAAAHSLAAAHMPHIVLADYRLRGQDDGVATVRALREQHAGGQANIPPLAALLISGDTAPQRLRDAQAAGLVLLHKPVPVGVLVQAIHAAMRPSSHQANYQAQHQANHLANNPASNEFDEHG